MEMADRPVVLFDGVCNLCDAAVLFVIDRDRAGAFRFAALQSEAGVRLLRERGRAAVVGEPESLLLVEGTEVYASSDALLRIARRLDGPWPLLGSLVLVPRFLREAAYRFVAHRRYRWFGRTTVCRTPAPGLGERFLR